MGPILAEFLDFSERLCSCVPRLPWQQRDFSAHVIDFRQDLASTFMIYIQLYFTILYGGSIAEWLACWTQAQKGLGSNRSRDAVG